MASRLPSLTLFRSHCATLYSNKLQAGATRGLPKIFRRRRDNKLVRVSRGWSGEVEHTCNFCSPGVCVGQVLCTFCRFPLAYNCYIGAWTEPTPSPRRMWKSAGPASSPKWWSAPRVHPTDQRHPEVRRVRRERTQRLLKLKMLWMMRMYSTAHNPMF